MEHTQETVHTSTYSEDNHIVNRAEVLHVLPLPLQHFIHKRPLYKTETIFSKTKKLHYF
jgi:hypothetical protein